MKKLVMILMVLMIALFVCACDEKEPITDPIETTDVTAVEKTPLITEEPLPTTDPTSTPEPTPQIPEKESPPIFWESYERDPDEKKDEPQILMEAAIAGCWHDNYMVANGYSERFILFNNNKFVWLKSQMDGLSRLYKYDGYWEVIDDNLVLSIKTKYYFVGGEIVENLAVGDYIKGATEDYEIIEPAEVVVYENLNINYDASDDDSGYKNYPINITIGDKVYWKFDQFPDTVEYILQYTPLFGIIYN